MRKLVTALLALVLLVPAASYALGLGDIHLHSALNQPLNADIDLLSVNPAQVDDIKVTLGSYEDFAQVGIDRPSVLMYLKFTVQKGSDGAYRIHLSSHQPIREPFLDFLIEVNWPSGRLLREYTMLIDPPNMAKQEAAPAVQAPAAAAPAAVRPAPTTPTTPPTTVTAPPSALPAAFSQAPSKGLRYGPVKKDDTLWGIAQKIRPDSSVSVQQVMMALLKANPQAFYDNNVNRLKAGYVLRIDDPKLIRAMSEAEATRAIQQQTRAWRDYRQQAAGEAQSRHATQATATPSKAVATREGAHLKLVSPEKGKGAGAGAKGSDKAAGDVKHQLMLAQESAAAKEKENEDLHNRVKELENQVASMQRLLSLKDSDLAALQQQLHKGAAATTAPTPEAAKPETAVAKPEVQTKPEAAAQSQPKPETAAKPEAEKAKPAPAPVKPVAPKPMPKPVAPAPQPQVSAIQGILNSMLANPVVLGGVAIALLSILALVWLIIRRRRASEFQESILSGGTSSMLANKTGEGAPSEDTSFFSDFAVSGMGNIQTEDNEVDPLTEADVYMAYGRYQQAEELLKDALDRTPERHELLVKLLELYYTTKNSEAFEARSEEAYQALDGSGPLWDKVLGMGHELLPQNPMFSSAPAAGASSAAAHDDVPQDDILDIGLDLDALASEMEPSDEETAAAGHGGDDFSLDLGVDFGGFEESSTSETAEAAESTAGSEETAAADDSLLDFDLSGFGEEGTETEQGAEPGESPSEDNALDFSASFDEAPVTEPEPEMEAEPAAGEEKDENLLDFDLGDFEMPADEASSAPAETLEGGAAFEDLDFDLGEAAPAAEPTEAPREAVAETTDFDLDSLTSESPEAPAGGGELSDDELFADLDENDTKLDLAKAYIDMGDGEGARGILDEVLNSGNDEQKQQAEALLKQAP